MFAISEPLPGSRKAIREQTDTITPQTRAGDFAQAMMDLGATICRPKNPACPVCPLAADCLAFASGDPTQFPAPRTKPTRPHRHGIAWWIERDGKLLRQMLRY